MAPNPRWPCPATRSDDQRGACLATHQHRAMRWSASGNVCGRPGRRTGDLGRSPPGPHCPVPCIDAPFRNSRYEISENGERTRAPGCGQWRRRCCAGRRIKRSSYQLRATVHRPGGDLPRSGGDRSPRRLAGGAQPPARMISAARAWPYTSTARCAGARQATCAVILAGAPGTSGDHHSAPTAQCPASTLRSGILDMKYPKTESALVHWAVGTGDDAVALGAESNGPATS